MLGAGPRPCWVALGGLLGLARLARVGGQGPGSMVLTRCLTARAWWHAAKKKRWGGQLSLVAWGFGSRGRRMSAARCGGGGQRSCARKKIWRSPINTKF
jgi:hypothetical protein